ncbi:MAG TPA: DUF4397 domain-containing protein, partial [Albitalea sp.]|uniref:DUF4397 domain-containing protein n=1 Tax=Piscinibacter sp. TaxID=1903157 RepID=UPI002ED625B4
MNPRTWFLRIALWLLALSLQACGGGGNDDGSATLRLVNATQGYASLDLYTSDTKQISALAASSASSYLTLAEGTTTLRLRQAGSATNAWSQDRSLAKDTAYTLVAYNNGTTLSTAILADSQSAPTSGYAALRVFNTGGDIGTVDVYVTAPDVALADVSATVSGLASATLGSYGEIAKGNYRIRVTGTGDKTDLRLDISSVDLADQQIATLILQSTPGGVLANGMLLNQKGSLTTYANANARVRVVAAVAGNALVTASTSNGTLAGSLQSPSVGSYVLTPATLAGLSLKVNGTALDTS